LPDVPALPNVTTHPDQENSITSEGNATSNLSIFQLADNAYVQQSFCSGDPSVVRALEILSILKSHYDRTQYNKNYLAHTLLSFMENHRDHPCQNSRIKALKLKAKGAEKAARARAEKNT
jgi:hypothetical protein